MAHWAKINAKGKVIQVIVTDNQDSNKDEGYKLLTDVFGGNWLQTSYNTIANTHLLGGLAFRGNFAGLGFSYDKKLDLFLPPKPFNSWLVDKEKASWKAPKPQPDFAHYWNEEKLNWELSNPPYPSWNYDPKAGQFVAPKERPDNKGTYLWDEDSLNWIKG
tara:strand:- start:196 stop:678 length:483 start_codon:yes stop_codon:yes gene_type:complete